MAMTTKKMRLRTSKRNNKPKTSKRKNNKSYTKKRNSAIKGKKNSRRVRKQKGGKEIISDEKLLEKIKEDFYDESYIKSDENQKKTLTLDLAEMLTMCMFYINPEFYEIYIKDKQYSPNSSKIFNLFNSYIIYLETIKIDLIDLNIYINTENGFNYKNNRGRILYDTEFITNLLFNGVMKNLLDKKINFKLTINDDLIIPFTQPLNIEEITKSINAIPFYFNIRKLLNTKLKEWDIIGFGLGAIFPNNNAKPTNQQFPNE